MKVENWVSWGSVEVGSWVSTDSVVTSRVDSEVASCEVTVDVILECLDSTSGDEGEDLRGSGPFGGCVGREITLQAAGVMGVETSWVGDGTILGRLHWTKVDDHAIDILVCNS